MSIFYLNEYGETPIETAQRLAMKALWFDKKGTLCMAVCFGVVAMSIGTSLVICGYNQVKPLGIVVYMAGFLTSSVFGMRFFLLFTMPPDQHREEMRRVQPPRPYGIRPWDELLGNGISANIKRPLPAPPLELSDPIEPSAEELEALRLKQCCICLGTLLATPGDEERSEDGEASSPREGADGEACSVCEVASEAKSVEHSVEDCDAQSAQLLQLGCDHCFHADCMMYWLKRQRVCPLCRTPVLRATTLSVPTAAKTDGARRLSCHNSDCASELYVESVVESV